MDREENKKKRKKGKLRRYIEKTPQGFILYILIGFFGLLMTVACGVFILMAGSAFIYQEEWGLDFDDIRVGVGEGGSGGRHKLYRTLPSDDDGIRFYIPVPEGYISSGFGLRSCSGCSRNHKGIDIALRGREIQVPIYPSRPGKVVDVKKYGEGRYSSFSLPSRVQQIPTSDERIRASCGQEVTILHEDINMYSKYCHMYRVNIKVGEMVGMGDSIGIIGNTGSSNGAHLHFEISTSLNGGQLNPITRLYCKGERLREGSNISHCFDLR